jgi:methylthioribose-1-phosphate isomerase
MPHAALCAVNTDMATVKTLFRRGRTVYILDQRLLPGRIKYLRCRTYQDVAAAIRDMAIRGAPAIGVAAAFGVALAARQKRFTSVAAMKTFLKRAIRALAATRPTAVNLFWALAQMERVIGRSTDSPEQVARVLENESAAVYRNDSAVNRRIGANGARLLKKGAVVLTHCNAGALATAEYGTALGVIRSAHRQGRIRMVFVDETRPYLQGARLTAWEMRQEKIPYVLITDNMAGHFMKSGAIDAVIVGADRIAANGDAANKIGTYSLAVLARYHGIPLYVAAPTSTIDHATKSGAAITIEERSAREVLYINKKSIAPSGTNARHPAFDVTPARLIRAIITEKGVFKPSEIAKI